MWGAILLILGCAFVFFLCLIPLYSKKLNNKRTWLSTISGGVILVLLVTSYFYFKFDETKSN
ncbi:hypothetical protein [Metabacillus sediminilitoris]|uniref:Uncharacterized protein n=1 Tax=Metabacillus sediminilitoris TaxID=2567941 RepID=A0A4S4BHT6_9BACI|nr:hypothetical protein [Metabacillus sediminilitoris]QGQ46370.1 hypothetical protein GMB29_14785 [Metabacillus sediminilitoris]THF73897.1 hypothetical protein E6W99_25970 [Metabacillus sediminilitoris]